MTIFTIAWSKPGTDSPSKLSPPACKSQRWLLMQTAFPASLLIKGTEGNLQLLGGDVIHLFPLLTSHLVPEWLLLFSAASLSVPDGLDTRWCTLRSSTGHRVRLSKYTDSSVPFSASEFWFGVWQKTLLPSENLFFPSYFLFFLCSESEKNPTLIYLNQTHPFAGAEKMLSWGRSGLLPSAQAFHKK